MKTITKLFTALVMLVFVTQAKAQTTDVALDEVLDAVTAMEESADQVSSSLRTTIIKYIFGIPSDVETVFLQIRQELSDIEEYSDEVNYYAGQAERFSYGALDMTVVKDAASNIEATGDNIEINVQNFETAVTNNHREKAFFYYRALYDDMRVVNRLFNQITSFVNDIDRAAFASYNVKVNLVDANGVALPAFTMESYTAKNLETGKNFYSDEDFYVENSGYVESTIFRTLPKGTYTFRGIPGVEVGEVAYQEIAIDETMINEEGYVEVTLEYVSLGGGVSNFDVEILLEDRNGNSVAVGTLPGYYAKNVETGEYIYAGENQGQEINVFEELAAGTYVFGAYDGYFDGASSQTVTLSEALVNQNGVITITLSYWSE